MVPAEDAEMIGINPLDVDTGFSAILQCLLKMIYLMKYQMYLFIVKSVMLYFKINHNITNKKF